MDVKLAAANLYGTLPTGGTKASAPKDPVQGGVSGFADSFAETLKTGEATAKSAIAGSADPHSLVQALAETQLAVETAVTVRDRVVEAYQEIIRMPV